jgi:ABC-type amino acid transport substrate-binding protein
MKRRPSPRWLAALLCGLAFAAMAAPLRVGGFVVAPLVMADGAKPTAPLTGALRDYMEQELVRHEGLELEWAEPTSYSRAIESLRSGKIDVLLMTSVTQDRAGFANFKWSYLRVRPHLAVMKGSPLQHVDSLQQLAGMEIGWVANSPLVEGLDQVPIKWQLLSAADWQQMNLRKLKLGRIQAVFYENEYSPQYYARREQIDIQLIRLPLPERAFMMAYSLKSDPAAIARFDKAAAAAFAGERFRQFLEQYMKK